MAVNVPNVPGVPSVIFAPGAGTITTLVQDTILGLAAGAVSAPWGIYLGFVPVVIADTVTSFDYKQQWSIADFPIERGGFESYNKVAVPFEVGFRFASGGTALQRQALLRSLAAIAGTTQLYNVVTADSIYLNVNISRYDYRQTATDGVGLLQIDVYATEIRQAVGAGVSNTQSPSSAPQSNSGPVKTTAATTTQEAKLPPVRNGSTTGPF